jgi:uncharacterized lipoprotein YmbA
MKKTYEKLILLIVFIAIIGCGGSKPSRYYLLSELKQAESISLTSKQLKIGIGPIRFPEYLKRPQIGIFLSENQLSYAEYDRWAEPLDENFVRVLTENLSELVQVDEIYTYPFIGAPKIDYQLILDVREFGMDDQEQVTLSVQWQIFKTDDQESVSTQRASYVQKVNSDNYSSIVAGMSQTVENFSRHIEEFFREIE